jgi:rhamnosyltransferase
VPPDCYRVAAYITAHEDGEALNTCIAAIKSQTAAVERILIVDNSTAPLELAPEHQQDGMIVVWHYPENIGIAGGLERAIAYSIEQKYDFLWTFDQDSAPLPNCLELLLKTYSRLATDTYAIGIVAPTPLDARTGEVVQASRWLGDRFVGFSPPDANNPYECDAPITSGSLVGVHTTQTVPPPNPALFIDGVDLDYGLRLRQAGFHNLVVPSACMYHRFGTPIQVVWLGRKKTFQIYSPFRYYYICRNQTWIEWHHSHNGRRLTCFLWRLRYLMLSIGIILAFAPNTKWLRIQSCLLGTYHGFTNQLGKLP